MKEFCIEKLQKRWMQKGELDEALLKEALDLCAEKTVRNLSLLGDKTAYDIAAGGKYQPVDNTTWTAGFWPGILWKMYLHTKDKAFCEAAKKHSLLFEERLKKGVHVKSHDLGFISCLSSNADFLITDDERAKQITIEAAYKLCDLYRFKGRIIQRSGDLSDLTYIFCGAFIVDCMNNVPLLFQAARYTEDNIFYDIACNHMKSSVDTLIMKNGAVCQTGIADVESGEKHPDFNMAQGKGGEDAAWGRGQAWAISGLPITYQYTKDKDFLVSAKAAVNYFLNRMPDDLISNWDLYYTDNDTQRDTSASAIAVCGLLRLAEILPKEDEDKEIYYNAAIRILNSLVKNYFIKDMENMGLLSAGTYGYTMDKGINTPNIFGDYYFVEALMTALKTDKDFWYPGR